MEPQIVSLAEKKMVGIKISTTIAENRTVELWRSFMPRRNEIKYCLNSDLYSLQYFDSSISAKSFGPDTSFDKWAAVEVADTELIPQGMDTCTLGGLYAVFQYRGLPQDVDPTFHYIYEVWLPSSQYMLDSRAHFAIMGSKYKNNDPSSEEELWIPLKSK